MLIQFADGYAEGMWTLFPDVSELRADLPSIDSKYAIQCEDEVVMYLRNVGNISHIVRTDYSETVNRLESLNSIYYFRSRCPVVFFLLHLGFRSVEIHKGVVPEMVKKIMFLIIRLLV